jgi:H+-transporting ATPase
VLYLLTLYIAILTYTHPYIPYHLYHQAAIDAITHAVERDVESFGLRGIRTLAVAKTNERSEWEFLGMLTFLDPPRPDTKQTIDDAIKYGVAVKMITGVSILVS